MEDMLKWGEREKGKCKRGNVNKKRKRRNRKQKKTVWWIKEGEVVKFGVVVWDENCKLQLAKHTRKKLEKNKNNRMGGILIIPKMLRSVSSRCV